MNLAKGLLATVHVLRMHHGCLTVRPRQFTQLSVGPPNGSSAATEDLIIIDEEKERESE